MTWSIILRDIIGFRDDRGRSGESCRTFVFRLKACIPKCAFDNRLRHLRKKEREREGEGENKNK